MKMYSFKTLALILLILLSAPIWAQSDNDDSGEKSDTTEKESIQININFGEDDDDGDVVDVDEEKNSITINRPNKSSKEPDNISTRWMMMDIGMNTYLAEDGAFELPKELGDIDLDLGRSREFSLHIFRQRVNLIKHHVNLMYGLTTTWNSYHFKNDITLIKGADSLDIGGNTEELNFKRNKLRITTLTIPLLLNFETKPNNKNRSFRINAGGYAGYNIGTMTKQRSDEKGKVKVRDDFNTNDFHYGLMAQVGVGLFNVYGKYALTPLFKEDQGPVLYPFSVGISLIYF